MMHRPTHVDKNQTDVLYQHSKALMKMFCLSFAVTLFVTLAGFTTSCAYAGDALPSGTRIHLSAMVETHIPNDEVVINFRIEQKGKNAAAVRQYVNRVSDAVHQRFD
jgi:predicted secreted protein